MPRAFDCLHEAGKHREVPTVRLIKRAWRALDRWLDRVIEAARRDAEDQDGMSGWG